MEHIEKAIEENDPIDGFVAFSQVIGNRYVHHKCTCLV